MPFFFFLSFNFSSWLNVGKTDFFPLFSELFLLIPWEAFFCSFFFFGKCCFIIIVINKRQKEFLLERNF